MATCQREAPAAHRKVSTGPSVTADSGRCPASQSAADPTPLSPECVPALIQGREDRACSWTSTPLWHHTSTAHRAFSKLVDLDLTWTLVMVVLLCLTTPDLLPRTTPIIDWLVRKVHLSPCRLSGPNTGGWLQRRVTPPRQMLEWLHRAQSGRTGRGTGGRSGSCCPRTMLTHCLRRWCDRPPVSPFLWTLCFSFLAPWRCLRVQLLPYSDFYIKEPLVFVDLYENLLLFMFCFVEGIKKLPSRNTSTTFQSFQNETLFLFSPSSLFISQLTTTVSFVCYFNLVILTLHYILTMRHNSNCC